MNKLHNRSIRLQLILVLLLISLLPFVLLGLYTIHKTTTVMRDQVFEMEMEYLDKSSIQLESYLQYAESYFSSTATQEIMSKYFYSDLNYREYSSLVSVQRWLGNFLSQQNITRAAYFINFEKNYVIGNTLTGFYVQDDETENILMSLIEESEQQNKTIFWTNIPNWDGLKRTGKNGYFEIEGITLFIKCPMYSNSRQGAILVSIDSGLMKDLLKRTDSQNSSMTIIDEHGTVIYCEDSSWIGESAEDIPVLDEVDFGTDRNTCYIQNSSGSYYASYLKGSNGWVYMTLNEAGRVESSLNHLLGTYLLLGGCIVCLLLAVILLICRWLYTPIRGLVMRIGSAGEDKAGRVTGNEFRIIEAGVDSMMTQKQLLEKQILLFQNSLKELFLLKLIKHQLSPEQADKEIDEIGIERGNQSMAILVFQMVSQEDSGSAGLLQLMERIYGVLPLDKTMATTIFNGLFVVWMGSSQNTSEFMSGLFQISETVAETFSEEGNTISVGISEVFGDCSQVRSAYYEAAASLAYHPQTENNVLLSAAAEPSGPYFPDGLCGQLNFSIRNGVMEDVEKALNRIAKSIYCIKRDPRIYEVYVIRLAASVLTMTEEPDLEQKNLQDALPEHIAEGLARVYDVRSMCHFFMKHLIRPMMQAIGEGNSSDQEELSRRAVTIIRSGFTSDLTLESCATQLGCHPMYLWQVFKEQNHATFSQYLEDYRFHMAQKWLTETDRSIAVIAEDLRYSNSQNFIRSFKKKTGLTPGQYRSQYRP